MKVSIIGAGLSGLSCAFYLEKYGIEPIIYEENDRVGSFYRISEAMLEILTRPIIDPYSFLGQKYQLYLNPVQTINYVDFISPTEQATVEGFQGFTNLRGNTDLSLERQLLRKLKSPIQYHSSISYKEVATDSDAVVLATGEIKHLTFENIQLWKSDVEVDLVVATIEGKFQKDRVKVWLNHFFAPKGYAYLLPWDESKASLALAIPKQDKKDIKELWAKFLLQIEFDYKIVELFDIHSYSIGQPEKNQIGNTYFIGNEGGFLLPFMGFGQFPSILSGILAAESIINRVDFNVKIKDFRKDYRRSLAIRRLFERSSQEQLDLLVKSLNNKGIQTIYKTPNLNWFKWLGGIFD